MGQNGVQVTLYADDTCVYNTSKSAEIATRRLDIHINRTLIPYLDNNKIKSAALKTEKALFSQRKADEIKGNLKIQGISWF